MKRSEINKLIYNSMEFITKNGHYLPQFAYWTPKEWSMKGKNCHEIKDLKLGWDITDFGLNDFNKIGLILFTLRNGQENSYLYQKTYAEKYLIVEEGQVTPMHFHGSKMEDIINRGGGNLMIQLFNSTEDEKIDKESTVNITIDAYEKTVPPGTILKLLPGESICISQFLYHSFWGEVGSGKVLVGEVSKVNDDNNDNRFLEKAGRFPEIEEDDKPDYLLCFEYPSLE